MHASPVHTFSERERGPEMPTLDLGPIGRALGTAPDVQIADARQARERFRASLVIGPAQPLVSVRVLREVDALDGFAVCDRKAAGRAPRTAVAARAASHRVERHRSPLVCSKSVRGSVPNVHRRARGVAKNWRQPSRRACSWVDGCTMRAIGARSSGRTKTRAGGAAFCFTVPYFPAFADPRGRYAPYTSE